ncbi:MFS transporter [Novosphingobium sp. FSY-8]|uniref:MFS transporter n=1 Tax=Novosphingobium ovatum TaxID=1908523 RepID=A0ABW9XBS9_9SPHN|nr:MFS transporter [Novosphingobium ovatum]NBC35997.1 MFS transporter [Novosphingobium ovatum]
MSAQAHTQTHSADAPLSTATCLGFGVGTVGVSIMLNTVTAYFPAFMSTVMGVSPAIVGLIMMGAKLYDAIADVVIGHLSDRHRSAWGRRKPFMAVGALLSAISFFMLFSPPKLDQTALIWYMIAGQIIYSTAYSLFNVPYIAMPAELTHGYHERTKLLGWRTVFVSIGQMLATAGTAAVINANGKDAHAYGLMGVIMALIIFGAMTACTLSVPRLHAPRNAAGEAPTDHPPLWGQVKLLTKNRPYMLLLGAKVFQFFAFASMGACALLFMLNVLGVGYEGQIWLSMTQNVVSALSMPLWVRIGRRIGKRRTYLIGVLMFCAASGSWMLASKGIAVEGLIWRGVLSGAGSGAIILMSIAMLGDAMAYDRFTTGIAREGLMSSTVAVVEKASSAIGAGLLGVFLAWFHFVPTMGGKLVQQPESALFALQIGYSVIPMAMFLANGFFLYLYDLDANKLDAARKAALGE